MEDRSIKRNVALVEKCVMSSVGIYNLFNARPNNQYQLHPFSGQPALSQAMSQTSFSAVIFSLSAKRTDRRTGLAYMTELAVKHPRIKRVVIADDDGEARLIGSLSPSPLDAVISKASTLSVLQEELFAVLDCARGETEDTKKLWYINQCRMLSPTEREILRYMSNGYSMLQIAIELERNIKTIRAHKFNVMSKLGVSSDAGLLDAADILLHVRSAEPSSFRRTAPLWRA